MERSDKKKLKLSCVLEVCLFEAVSVCILEVLSLRRSPQDHGSWFSYVPDVLAYPRVSIGEQIY